MGKRIEIRIDAEKKAKFKQKAENEYGSMSRFLQLVIHAYTKEDGFASDKELTAMLYAIRALNSYTTNINQITKRMHQSGNIPANYELRKLEELKQYSSKTAQAIRDCLARKNEQIAALKN